MPTIQDFKDTIEVMRGIYPFSDDKTFITQTNDLCNRKPLLELNTIDKDTGVEISLKREYIKKECEEIWRL